MNHDQHKQFIKLMIKLVILNGCTEHWYQNTIHLDYSPLQQKYRGTEPCISV